jgi:hypothetical protein
MLVVLGFASLCLVRFHGRETRPERIRYPTNDTQTSFCEVGYSQFEMPMV